MFQLQHLNANFETTLRQLSKFKKLADECSTAHIFDSNYCQDVRSKYNRTLDIQDSSALLISTVENSFESKVR